MNQLEQYLREMDNRRLSLIPRSSVLPPKEEETEIPLQPEQDLPPAPELGNAPVMPADLPTGLNPAQEASQKISEEVNRKLQEKKLPEWGLPNFTPNFNENLNKVIEEKNKPALPPFEGYQPLSAEENALLDNVLKDEDRLYAKGTQLKNAQETYNEFMKLYKDEDVARAATFNVLNESIDYTAAKEKYVAEGKTEGDLVADLGLGFDVHQKRKDKQEDGNPLSEAAHFGKQAAGVGAALFGGTPFDKEQLSAAQNKGVNAQSLLLSDKDIQQQLAQAIHIYLANKESHSISSNIAGWWNGDSLERKEESFRDLATYLKDNFFSELRSVGIDNEQNILINLNNGQSFKINQGFWDTLQGFTANNNMEIGLSIGAALLAPVTLTAGAGAAAVAGAAALLGAGGAMLGSQIDISQAEMQLGIEYSTDERLRRMYEAGALSLLGDGIGYGVAKAFTSVGAFKNAVGNTLGSVKDYAFHMNANGALKFAHKYATPETKQALDVFQAAFQVDYPQNKAQSVLRNMGMTKSADIVDNLSSRYGKDEMLNFLEVVANHSNIPRNIAADIVGSDEKIASRVLNTHHEVKDYLESLLDTSKNRALSFSDDLNELEQGIKKGFNDIEQLLDESVPFVYKADSQWIENTRQAFINTNFLQVEHQGSFFKNVDALFKALENAKSYKELIAIEKQAGNVFRDPKFAAFEYKDFIKELKEKIQDDIDTGIKVAFAQEPKLAQSLIDARNSLKAEYRALMLAKDSKSVKDLSKALENNLKFDSFMKVAHINKLKNGVENWGLKSYEEALKEADGNVFKQFYAVGGKELSEAQIEKLLSQFSKEESRQNAEMMILNSVYKKSFEKFDSDKILNFGKMQEHLTSLNPNLFKTQKAKEAYFFMDSMSHLFKNEINILKAAYKYAPQGLDGLVASSPTGFFKAETSRNLLRFMQSFVSSEAAFKYHLSRALQRSRSLKELDEILGDMQVKSTFSPKDKVFLDGFKQAINAYAKAYEEPKSPLYGDNLSAINGKLESTALGYKVQHTKINTPDGLIDASIEMMPMQKIGIHHINPDDLPIIDTQGNIFYQGSKGTQQQVLDKLGIALPEDYTLARVVKTHTEALKNPLPTPVSSVFTWQQGEEALKDYAINVLSLGTESEKQTLGNVLAQHNIILTPNGTFKRMGDDPFGNEIKSQSLEYGYPTPLNTQVYRAYTNSPLRALAFDNPYALQKTYSQNTAQNQSILFDEPLESPFIGQDGVLRIVANQENRETLNVFHPSLAPTTHMNTPKGVVQRDFDGSVAFKGDEGKQAISGEVKNSIADIHFTDKKGNPRVLTPDIQNLWINTFKLQHLDETYIPKHNEAIKQALGGKEIRLTKGSLLKLVERERTQYINEIKQTLDTPDVILRDIDNMLILGKKIGDKEYFTSVNLETNDFYISVSNAPKKESVLTNKVNNGAKILYESPSFESITYTPKLLQASQSSTNKIHISNPTTPALNNALDFDTLSQHMQKAGYSERYLDKILPDIEKSLKSDIDQLLEIRALLNKKKRPLEFNVKEEYIKGLQEDLKRYQQKLHSQKDIDELTGKEYSFTAKDIAYYEELITNTQKLMKDIQENTYFTLPGKIDINALIDKQYTLALKEVETWIKTSPDNDWRAVETPLRLIEKIDNQAYKRLADAIETKIGYQIPESTKKQAQQTLQAEKLLTTKPKTQTNSIQAQQRKIFEKEIAERIKTINKGYTTSLYGTKSGKKGGYARLLTQNEKEAILYKDYNKALVDKYLELKESKANRNAINKAIDNILESKALFESLNKPKQELKFNEVAFIKSLENKTPQEIKDLYHQVFYKKERTTDDALKEAILEAKMYRLPELTYKDYDLRKNFIDLKDNKVTSNSHYGKEEIKAIYREKIEQTFNIKPLKNFGTNYAEYYHDGIGAIQKVLQEKQGQVAGAFHRKELGDIDLVWGNEKIGLQKILEKHYSRGDFKAWGEGEESVIRGINEIIEEGVIVNKNGVDTIWHKKDDQYYVVGLSKGFYSKGENNWMISSYKRTNPPEEIKMMFSGNSKVLSANAKFNELQTPNPTTKSNPTTPALNESLTQWANAPKANAESYKNVLPQEQWEAFTQKIQETQQKNHNNQWYQRYIHQTPQQQAETKRWLENAIDSYPAKKSEYQEALRIIDTQELLPDIPDALKYGDTGSAYLIIQARRGDIIDENHPFYNLSPKRESIEKHLEITPLKELGTNYAEHYHNGGKAIEKIIREFIYQHYDAYEKKGHHTQKLLQDLLENNQPMDFKAQVAGAFHRKELGDIDLVWGEVSKNKKGELQGYGLSKIIAKHGEEFKNFAGKDLNEKVAKGIDEIIRNGEIVKLGDRATIVYKTNENYFKIGLKGNWRGEPTQNKWIITAYDDKEEMAKTIDSNHFTKGETLPSTSTTNLTTPALKQGLIPPELTKKRKELLAEQQRKYRINEDQIWEYEFKERGDVNTDFEPLKKRIKLIAQTYQEEMALLRSTALLKRFFSKDLWDLNVSNTIKFFDGARKADNAALKEFGTNYAEHYHNGTQAIQKLLQEKQGQVAGAFHRKELGDIDLVWGDSKIGLQKILEKHLPKGDFKAWGEGEESVNKAINEIIEKGKVVSENGADTIWYKKRRQYYTVEISRGWRGEGENRWIITARKMDMTPTEKTEIDKMLESISQKDK